MNSKVVTVSVRSLLPAAALLLVLPSCAILDDFEEDDEAREHRRVWLRHDIDAYTFDFQRSCFCLEGATRGVTIRVEDGAIVEVTDRRTGEPVPQDEWHYFRTVDELFEVVLDAVDREADDIDVEYDREYAFPRRISIDYIENAVDDEVVFTAANLRPGD